MYNEPNIYTEAFFLTRINFLPCSETFIILFGSLLGLRSETWERWTLKWRLWSLTDSVGLVSLCHGLTLSVTLAGYSWTNRLSLCVAVSQAGAVWWAVYGLIQLLYGLTRVLSVLARVLSAVCTVWSVCCIRETAVRCVEAGIFESVNELRTIEGLHEDDGKFENSSK